MATIPTIGPVLFGAVFAVLAMFRLAALRMVLLVWRALAVNKRSR